MLENIKVKNGTYIILEYANHGTLESLIRYFKKSGSAINSRLIWSVAAQVLDGLRHLHSLNIIHRDIKPANILINQIRHNGSSFLEFKIADFSLSTQKTAVEDRSVIGTPYYMAPEIVSKQKYDQRVDVWALGVIIYEMHHNLKPFSGSTRDVLYDEILNKDVTAQKSIKNDSLGSLIRRCLSRKQRPTPRELIKGSEKLRLTLTTIELRQREIQIEKLETRLKKSKVDQR
ncbi:MKK2 [Enterospora canceri]|uniref:MKK2 n=1 Tax=Enterospora canceri TaxID=1081671 RepID=A0A1Y1S7L3_9MICR|nr:MKK2 [Enterospora canceri]